MPARPDRESALESAPGERFGLLAHLDSLLLSDAEVGGLGTGAIHEAVVELRRVDEVEADGQVVPFPGTWKESPSLARSSIV